MYNSTDLLTNEQTASSKHNLMKSSIYCIIPQLRSAATVNCSSTNGFQFVRPVLTSWPYKLASQPDAKNPPILLLKSVMSLKNKALGPSVFHLGRQPEEVLKRERLIIITVILASPARSPLC